MQVLNRVSWGANQSSYAEIARLGSARWLEQQLDPQPGRMPPEVQARIDAMTISQRPVAELAAGLERISFVAAVRGRGLMLAIDLIDGEDAPELARRALLEQHVVVNATGPGTIRLEPPLIVSEEEIDDALGRLEALGS